MREAISESAYLGSEPEAHPPSAENLKNMFFIYIILSLSHSTRYIGSTDNIEKRLKEHNRGRVRYTKGRRPWQLIYSERFVTLSLARKREIYLKSGQGRKFIDNILSEAAGSSNGRIADSESAHLGSNPSPAASDGISI